MSSKSCFILHVLFLWTSVSCRRDFRQPLGSVQDSSLYDFHIGHQSPGWSPIEQYLTLNLSNFSHWATSQLSEVMAGIESVPMANYSDKVTISNRFYQVELNFTYPPTLTGLASKILPRCVTADLESGRITVAYSAYNVQLSGQYRAEASILNETRFTGVGSWHLGLQLGCVLETSFSFRNGTHVTLGDASDQARNSFRFYCTRKGSYFDQSGRGSSYDPFSCEYFVRSRVVSSRFDGLFNSTVGPFSGEDELAGAKRFIQGSLGKYFKKEVDFVALVPASLGSPLYAQLKDVIQEKSVFQLNFDVADYYKNSVPLLIVAF